MKITSKLLVLVISFVIVFTGCAKSIEQQVTEQLELGQRYLSEENYEEAIVAFGKVIELEPKVIEAYTGMATAYIGMDERKRAEETLDQGFAVVDALSGEERTEELLQNVELMTTLALENYEELLKLSQEDTSDVIRYYEKILAIDESRVEMYEELARLYASQGNYEKAIEVLDQGILSTGDEKLEDYKNQLETEQAVEEHYNEAIQNMIQYLEEHDGELSEDVLLNEEFQELVKDLKEPLIREYGEKYIGIYPSGYIYYGDMKNGKREGYGSWIGCGVDEHEGVSFSSYHKFEGEWRDDYPNGEGVDLIKNFNPPKDVSLSDEFRGNFADGYLDGRVRQIVIWQNGWRDTFNINVNHGKPEAIDYIPNSEWFVIAYSEEAPESEYTASEDTLFGVAEAMKE